MKRSKFKKGDLVRVKDMIGYSAYIQAVAGHLGVVTKIHGKHPTLAKVCFASRAVSVLLEDLEAICK